MASVTLTRIGRYPHTGVCTLQTPTSDTAASGTGDEQGMIQTVAFFNQKGGTAKTTSTLNVAAALAERGRSVLVADLDPQASLTMAVGVDVSNLD
ncbi:MAG: ParA family protein, partial [Chloroflexota bacterium]